MSMITATAWVPRGHAAAFPTKYVFDDDEYGRIAKLAKLQLEDAEEDLEQAQAAADGEEEEDGPEQGGVSLTAATNGNSSNVKRDKEEVDDDLKEYDLENYDDDEAVDSDGEPATMGMFANIKSLAYHESNAEDPYITIDGANTAAGEEDDDEEREELQIYPSDNLLLAARIEDEIAHLEVYVYEDDADNLYVHHDIMLPAYPLCVEWLNIGVGKGSDDAANFVAVGTMYPDIEVWDLDMVDCMYPNAILGPGADELKSESKPKKKKKKKSKKPNDKYHVDAVLSLAANKQHRNLLASSSADTTVKLWDLHTATCAKSYQLHTDKVCSIAWNSAESTVLLTGSYDRSITASDMRAPGAKVPRWRVESDVETVQWDPHRSELFYVSTENGLIHCYDVRSPPSSSASSGVSKGLWSLQAHDESLSSFDINPLIPGFIATGSTDKTVKLWSVDAATGPSMVISRDLDVGKVFSTTFAPDQEVGFRLAVAGSKGSVMVWDTATNAAVRKIFADRVPKIEEGKKEKVVGVDASDDESEDDEEEEEGVEDEDERSDSPSEDDSDEVMEG